MLGLGKRRRELEEAAKRIALALVEEAVGEDKHRCNQEQMQWALVGSVECLAALLGVPTEQMLAQVRWEVEGRAVWQEAKRGRPDAIRQTARNYVFGTGRPVHLQKARRWLEAACIIEASESLRDPPDINVFWSSLEEELDKVLTDKERMRAKRHAAEWVSGLRRAHPDHLNGICSGSRATVQGTVSGGA